MEKDVMAQYTAHAAGEPVSGMGSTRCECGFSKKIDKELCWRCANPELALEAAAKGGEVGGRKRAYTQHGDIPIPDDLEGLGAVEAHLWRNLEVLYSMDSTVAVANSVTRCLLALSNIVQEQEDRKRIMQEIQAIEIELGLRDP